MKLSHFEKQFEQELQNVARNQDANKIVDLARRAPTEKTKGWAIAVAACHAENLFEAQNLLKEARSHFIDNYQGLTFMKVFEAIIFKKYS